MYKVQSHYYQDLQSGNWATSISHSTVIIIISFYSNNNNNNNNGNNNNINNDFISSSIRWLLPVILTKKFHI